MAKKKRGRPKLRKSTRRIVVRLTLHEDNPDHVEVLRRWDESDNKSKTVLDLILSNTSFAHEDTENEEEDLDGLLDLFD